jgi:3-methyladenine DNA glycosylase AlkD
MIENLYEEITESIAAAADHRQPTPETRYHRHREYISYGLKAADLWSILKGLRPRLRELLLTERLDLAARLLAQHIGELGHAGIYVQVLSVRELEPEHFPYLDETADDWRSWSHVDYFCGDLMQPLLKRLPEETLAQIDRWVASPNRWKRRASVVTFTRSVGKSGQYTDIVLELCDRLKWDLEDIVQKGVGWTLKDNMRAAPEQITAYVKELRREGVPSTITLYAIRDLKGEARQEVMAVKKA